MSTGLAVAAVLAAAGVIWRRAAAYQRAPWCWCGHPRSMHSHHNQGTYCGPCGPDSCPRFRAPLIRRITAWR